ncbi:MAG: DUF2314 domain-containing protein [Spirochaetes bacterium]|nr:DUF2314 domain-containing protein [Spirochaetota bacterium]
MLNKLNKKKKSPVTIQKGEDEELSQAYVKARESFPLFWNQFSSDFNRIIPAIEMASLKVQFSDDPDDLESAVEHMWVNIIDFDGKEITGTLINSPNWLKKYKLNDEVCFPVSQISDWLCVIGGVTYGGFTVQLIRSRMNKKDRLEFDKAWGLDFPSPEKVLIPERNDKFDKSLADIIKNQIEDNPKIISQKFDKGRTLLHLSALYGRYSSVELLLKSGAKKSVKCKRGWTALDYAESLGWKEIIDLLKS